MTNNILNLQQLPPLSLYIHFPWCISKCPYCDFNSHKLNGILPERRYLDSLIQDLEQALPLIWGRTIQTIFLGGGTPSLISGAGIEYLLSQLRMRLNLSPYVEITLEANPSSVDLRYINEYQAAGVNRISLGIQSFNDKHLKQLGRSHNRVEAQEAITLVTKHFDNFNLDLMYGLPDQTQEQALQDMTMALSFNPTHISAYNLTLEPNTKFAKYPPANLPDLDACYAMQDNLNCLLASHGYKRYEISAFAQAGFQAQHNLNYWKFGDYLGIGAGAHSKISFSNHIIRQVRQKHPQRYMDGVLAAQPLESFEVKASLPLINQHMIENKIISLQELPFEFMLNALRLSDGFALTLFTATTGLPLSTILPQLLQAQDQGYLHLSSSQIIPTAKGQDFLNNCLQLFLE